jgi:hypothetical protein
MRHSVAEDEARRDEETAKKKHKADREAMEARLKEQFLRTPGTTEEDWKRLSKQIIDQHLVKMASTNDAEARTAMRGLYTG